MSKKRIIVFSLLPILTSCRGVIVDKGTALNRLNGIIENLKKETFKMPASFTREFEVDCSDSDRNCNEIAYLNVESQYLQVDRSGPAYGEEITTWIYVVDDEMIVARRDSSGSVYNTKTASSFNNEVASYLSIQSNEVFNTPDNLMELITSSKYNITYESYLSRGAGQLSADLELYIDDRKETQNFQFDGNKVTLIEKKVFLGADEYEGSKVSYRWNIAKWQAPILSEFEFTTEKIAL